MRLAINEIILAIIVIVGIFILIRLVESKNGYFRKLLIGYFVVEIYVFFGLAVFISIKTRAPIIPFLPFIIVPKMIIKLFFYYWLSKNKKIKK